MIESGLRSEHKFDGWEFQIRKMSDDQKFTFTIDNQKLNEQNLINSIMSG